MQERPNFCAQATNLVIYSIVLNRGQRVSINVNFPSKTMILRGVIPILILGLACCVLIGIVLIVIRIIRIVKLFRGKYSVENKLWAILQAERGNSRTTEKDSETASK